jgi:adenine-specific DNA-methyltransferase
LSTNISKQRRDELVAKITEIRSFISTAPQDKNTGRLLSYIGELEKEVCGKKYGLIFEEHRESIDDILKANTPVLTEEHELYIDNGGKINFLIEGDNLSVLQLLCKTHKGTIDVIFIDPPYNRGQKDFIYDDNYIDTTDTFRHSKYMSFMQKRLVFARKVLRNNGVIFINIDDNEFAQLKMLCDSIFGEENYIACFPWHNRTSVQNDTDMSINHEYILAYAKKRRITNRRLKPSNAKTWFSLDDFVFQPQETEEQKFENPDRDPRGAWKADPFDAPAVRENLTYEIINPNTGAVYLPPKGRHWRTEKAKYEELLADGRIVFGKNGTSKPQLKVFLADAKDKGQIANSWFDADVFDTSTNGKKELLKIFVADNEGDIFDTPKPKKMYIELLKLILSPKVAEPIILDFFAGSGTTGHAVMEYSKLHGKNCSFILCTNNQNNICRGITYERLKRVIGSENYKANLKYYRVEYIPISDKLYYEYADDLLLHIRELVELENGINFTGNAELAIVLTDEEMAEFVENTEALQRCATLYMGHDVLLTGEQEAELQINKIEIRIIPDYYYKELED